MSESSSFNTNTSSSTSSPTFIETPENSILDQLSGYAANLADQMNGWAQGVYAHTSAITDAAVNNFFNVSQSMTGFANRMTDQYNNTFAPENQQLVDDANSYASPDRMKTDMGQAGATQAQAGDQALRNEQKNLTSYGINVGDGSYVSLDKAAAVQNAANVAGAMNTQRNVDIDRGEKLRAQAVQVGATLPGAIANANNTAIQANSGASNATLANANTGANLKALANQYLQTAMGLKLPPTGQNSNSQSLGQGGGQSSGPGRGSGSGSGSGGGSGAGGGGAGSASGPAWMPDHSGANNPGIGVKTSQNPSGGGGGGGQPPPKTIKVPPEEEDWSVPPPPVIDPRDFYKPGMGIGEPTTGGIDNLYNNPFNNGQFGQTYGDNQGGTFGDLNQMNGGFIGTGGTNLTWDPSQNQAQLPGGWQDPTFQPNGPNGDFNWGDGQNQIGQAPADQMYNSPWGSGGDVNFGNNPNMPNYDYSSSAWNGTTQTDTGVDTSYQDYSSPSYPQTGQGQDTSYSDQAQGGGYDGYYAGGGGGGYGESYDNYDSGYSGEYARGGQVRRPQPQQQSPFPQQQRPMQNFQPGGNVTPNMSPSRGQRTDDVSANVNVGEYVVPKDVVQYKGHQFFENLVKQSRKNRAMHGMVQKARGMR